MLYAHLTHIVDVNVMLSDVLLHCVRKVSASEIFKQLFHRSSLIGAKSNIKA